MKITPLKCPSCAGEIQLDFDREIGYCMYCGSKVMIHDQANKSIKIDESGKIENWTILGFDSLRAKNAEDVGRYADKIIETDINNPAGWYLKGCTSKDNIYYAKDCWNRALSLSNNNKMIKDLATNAIYFPENHIIKKLRTVQFIRQSQMAGSVYEAKLFLDGRPIMNIRNGETGAINLDEGNYTLLVKFGFTKTEVPLNVDRNIVVNMGVDKRTNSFQVSQVR